MPNKKASQKDISTDLRKTAEKVLEKQLKACRMQDIFSVKQVTMWAKNEKKYGAIFPLKATYYLLPENVSLEKRTELMAAVVALTNEIPRKELGGKCPREAGEARTDKTLSLETFVFGTEQYEKLLMRSTLCMRDGNYEQAYGIFTEVIENLLRERIPLFSAFRIFINTAICQRYLDQIGMCKALIDAALRLNTHYDFGKTIKDRYTLEIEDFSHLPKKDRVMGKKILDAIEALGQREYSRTVFKKYEKFLNDIGVSLAYRTQTAPTVLMNGKIYPNTSNGQPCPCGSGKKFKKCHKDA
jgi:SEC-C motif